MTSTILRSALAAAACATVLGFAAPAFAETIKMKADLSGKSEVPANDSKGTGSVTATFDTDSKKLSYQGSYTDLSGPATAAHFHTGEVGKNGGVTVPIFAAATAKSPFAGEATLTDAQAADLLAGKLYANVHTEANKGGEIRGQVTK